MESILWVFKSIWDKKMVYQGHKAMQICPRCVTPLSNFEVSQGYKDVTDLSIIMKFELEEEPLTDEEMAQRELDAQKAEADRAEREAAEKAKADAKASALAKLSALGLTADEADALTN